ncbi:MAG: hypothetical protein ACRCWF_04185 [Beijerinckiaceae bacterium]
MLFRRTAFIATLAISVSACASVPLTSLIALGRIDFQTTAFEKVRVGVQLPDTIRTRENGVRMIAKVSYSGGAERQETLYLQEANSPSDRLPPAKTGHQTRVFQLREADVARLNTIRAEILAAKAEGRRGSLGFGIEAKEFCKAGDIGNGPVPISTYLRTAESPAFIPLQSNFDLRSDRQVGSALATLAPC